MEQLSNKKKTNFLCWKTQIDFAIYNGNFWQIIYQNMRSTRNSSAHKGEYTWNVRNNISDLLRKLFLNAISNENYNKWIFKL